MQSSRIVTQEELLETARSFNLLSDVFMSVVLEDVPAAQYVLRILLQKPDLIVKEVRTQYQISQLTSHDARLDALAEDSNGQLYDIEIQRSDTVDHARRTRFYAAMLDSSFLQKGKSYADLPETHIIYISESDLWKRGRTRYEVEKRFKDTDIPYDDGVHILYVNAAVDDGSETARLMRYFKDTSPQEDVHGALSRRVQLVKRTEGGRKPMSEAEKRFQELVLEMSKSSAFDAARKEGRELGIAEGRAKGIAEGIAEGRAKGIAEGIAEGRASGLVDAARATTLTLHDMGMGVENIAKAVHQSVEQVRQWLDAVPAV